jgi:putative glycosyltransferase (TIGR04372 family)
MLLLRRYKIPLIFAWYLATNYIYSTQRLLSLVIAKLVNLVIKTYLILIGQKKTDSKNRTIFGLIRAIQIRLSARATGQMFEYLERSVAEREIFEYFLKKCIEPQASAQLISSTAGMAISFGEYEKSLQLLAELIVRYPMEVSQQQQIGVKAFLSGKYPLAETIWTQCNQHREQLIKTLGLDKHKVRFLAPSWFIAIGHIAHLDIYLKHKILNGREDHKTYYSLPPSWKLPNAELMKRWSKYITPPPKSILKDFSATELSLLQDEFWSLQFEDGKSRMFSYAGSIVQHRWVNEGRTPLLNCTDLDSARGESTLERLGVPKGSWYVCLHVREPGFHRKWHKSNPGTRNADVMTYLPAIREIVARGGYVIRLGDRSMRPLPKEKGIVDYALSDLKSEFMDLFLCSTCKFFIGTNSGLGLVPPIFGVPCAMTNWSPVGLPQWYPSDTYIPKLIYSSDLGRFLTFKEMIFSEAGWAQFEKFLTQADLQLRDNSPEELKDFIIEMMGNLEGESENIYDHSQIDALVEKAGSYKGARLGNTFIQSHKELFEIT